MIALAWLIVLTVLAWAVLLPMLRGAMREARRARMLPPLSGWHVTTSTLVPEGNAFLIGGSVTMHPSTWANIVAVSGIEHAAIDAAEMAGLDPYGTRQGSKAQAG